MNKCALPSQHPVKPISDPEQSFLSSYKGGRCLYTKEDHLKNNHFVRFVAAGAAVIIGLSFPFLHGAGVPVLAAETAVSQQLIQEEAQMEQSAANGNEKSEVSVKEASVADVSADQSAQEVDSGENAGNTVPQNDVGADAAGTAKADTADQTADSAKIQQEKMNNGADAQAQQSIQTEAAQAKAASVQTEAANQCVAVTAETFKQLSGMLLNEKNDQSCEGAGEYGPDATVHAVYHNCGWYDQKPIGCIAVYQGMGEGIHGHDDAFMRINDTFTGGIDIRKCKGVQATFQFFYESDPSRNPINIENSFVTVGSLNDRESIRYENNPTETVYVDTPTDIRRDASGTIIGSSDAEDNRSAVVIPIQGTTQRFTFGSTDERYQCNGIYYILYTLNTYTMGRPYDYFRYKVITEVENGTITPSDEKVHKGDDFKAEYQPEEKHLLDSITVDGQSQDLAANTSEYLFKNVEADHNIKVVYVAPKAPILTPMQKGSEKNIDKEAVLSQDEIVYAVDVENPAHHAMDVTVTVPLPEGTEFESADNDGTLQDGTVIWKIHMGASPAEGDPVAQRVSFIVRVTDALKNKNFGTQAQADWYGLPSDVSLSSEPVVNYVLQEPQKSARHQDGRDADGTYAACNEKIAYTIETANPLPQDMSVRITDPVPAGLQFESADNGGTLQDGSVVFNVTVPAQGRISVTWTALIPSGAQGTILSNTASAHWEVTRSADLMSNEIRTPVMMDPVKKVCDTDGNDIHKKALKIRDEVVYNITFYNSDEKEHEFTITDVLPTGMECVSASDGGRWNGRTVRWTMNVPAKTRRTLSIRAKLSRPVGGTKIVNQAIVNVDGRDFPTNEVANYTMEIPRKRVFRAGDHTQREEAQIDGQTVEDQEELLFTITVRNPKDYAQTIRIRDQISAMDLGITEIEDGECNEGRDVITWVVHDVPAGKSAKVSFRARALADDKEKTVRNCAYASMDGTELCTNTVMVKIAAKKAEETDKTSDGETKGKPHEEDSARAAGAEEQSVGTGDDSQIRIWSCLIVCSCAVLALWLMRRRRN